MKSSHSNALLHYNSGTVTLGGCATHHVPAESLALGRYNFSYVVEGVQPNSFTQVFDDGANTFLQLSRPKHTKVRNQEDNEASSGRAISTHHRHPRTTLYRIERAKEADISQNTSSYKSAIC